MVPCRAQGDCLLATSTFVSHDQLLQDLGMVLVLVPGLIGLFWGAPLAARELETGTYQLAWTQGVTRKRWLAVKLGLVGLASVAVAGLFSLMMTWWSSPLDRVNADPFTLFDQRGIVPLGYAAFAFALGVCVGLVLHRTVPAMVATLAVFAGVRLVVANWVRPNLLAPLRLVAGLQAPTPNSSGGLAPPQAGDWTISDQVINAAGRVIGQDGAINLGGGRLGLGFGPAGNGSVALQGVGVCPNQFPAQARRGRWIGSQPGVPAGHAGVLHQAGAQGGADLPAHVPLLAASVVRDGHLCRPGPGPGRVLLLVAAAAVRLRGWLPGQRRGAVATRHN